MFKPSPSAAAGPLAGLSPVVATDADKTTLVPRF
jgi:hypothetical protein